MICSVSHRVFFEVFMKVTIKKQDTSYLGYIPESRNVNLVIGGIMSAIGGVVFAGIGVAFSLAGILPLGIPLMSLGALMIGGGMVGIESYVEADRRYKNYCRNNELTAKAYKKLLQRQEENEMTVNEIADELTKHKYPNFLGWKRLFCPRNAFIVKYQYKKELNQWIQENGLDNISYIKDEIQKSLTNVQDSSTLKKELSPLSHSEEMKHYAQINRLVEEMVEGAFAEKQLPNPEIHKASLRQWMNGYFKVNPINLQNIEEEKIDKYFQEVVKILKESIKIVNLCGILPNFYKDSYLSESILDVKININVRKLNAAKEILCSKEAIEKEKYNKVPWEEMTWCKKIETEISKVIESVRRI